MNSSYLLSAGFKEYLITYICCKMRKTLEEQTGYRTMRCAFDDNLNMSFVNSPF